MKRLLSILIILALASVASALDFSQSVGRISVKVSPRMSNVGSCCVFYADAECVLVSTAGHVTDGREAAYIEFTPEGRTGYHYPAAVLAQDRREDWAVLSIDAAKFIDWHPTPIRPIQPSETIAVDSTIYFAGFLSGQPLKAGITGLTGKAFHDTTGGQYVEVTRRFSQGESGGPVVALVGGRPRLIGIISIEPGFVPIDMVRTGYLTQCQCPGGTCQPPRRGNSTPDRLPSWIVPEVPDPPDYIQPSPERPVIVDDPNIPGAVADLIAPNSGRPDKPPANLEFFDAWKAEALRAADLERKLEAAEGAAETVEKLAEQIEDMDKTICDLQDTAKERAESVVETIEEAAAPVVAAAKAVAAPADTPPTVQPPTLWGGVAAAYGGWGALGAWALGVGVWWLRGWRERRKGGA